MWVWLFFSWRNWKNSFSSLFAPVKFVPWSLQMHLGNPLRQTKRRKVAMNASLVKSETNSKCTAFTVNDTKTNISLYDDWLPHVFVFNVEWPCPTSSKIWPGVTLSGGSLPCCCDNVFPEKRLQIIQLWVIDRTVFLRLMIWNRDVIQLLSRVGPVCSIRMCSA